MLGNNAHFKIILAALVASGTPLVFAAENNTDDFDSSWNDAWSEFEEPEEEPSPLTIATSLEAAVGSRIQDDPAIATDVVLGELRNRWDIFYDLKNGSITYKGDLYIDEIESNSHYSTREANIFYRFSQNIEFKLGRQILTWGTGDLLFLNDLFPKDWQSFFSGRDTRYLKAPSDAIKTSIYNEIINIDIVYSPEFDSDTYIDGSRHSYYSPYSDAYSATPPRLSPIHRDDSFSEDEIAIRLSKTHQGNEFALYFYEGFYKSPTGIDQDSFTPYFPELEVYGASYRTSALGGIINSELALYESKEDASGDNPLIPNDQLRFLAGYETELFADFTVAFQYYLEWTQDYEKLVNNSLIPSKEQREYRNIWTNRITYRTLNANLTYSLFTFYSYSDKDGYVRPSVNYRYSDQIHLTGGGNFFFGEDQHTFFNRFENNSNLYFRVKYYF